jgi:hypothetical protein
LGPWGRIKKKQKAKGKLFFQGCKALGNEEIFISWGYALSESGIKGNRGEKTHFWWIKKNLRGRKICAFDCSLGREDWSFYVSTIFYIDKKGLNSKIN